MANTFRNEEGNKRHGVIPLDRGRRQEGRRQELKEDKGHVAVDVRKLEIEQKLSKRNLLGDVLHFTAGRRNISLCICVS